MASKRQLAERKATVTNFQFHPKRTYEEPEPSPEMSPQEMQVAEKHYRDACIWIGNLHSAIRDPSAEQAAVIDCWIDALADQLLGIRSRLR